jgi:CSLREA domain-containing protein
MLFGEGSTMNTNQSTYLRLLLTTMLALGLIFSAPRVAWAATITVTTTDDELNADGDCSLREAVAAANNDMATDACPAGNGADSITVPAGTYGFTTAAELLITEDLTIVGAGRGATIIDANGLSRAVYINVSQVTISHLTIREGNASFSAGSNVYVGASSYLTLVSARLTAVPSGADRALWVRVGSGATVIDGRIDGTFFDRVAGQWRAEQDQIARDLQGHLGRREPR